MVTSTTREEAERAIEQLIPWLAARGLTLSMEKTRIVHISEGFDFLGFTIRQYAAPYTKKRGVTLRCTPSRKSVRRVRERLRDAWMALRGHPAREVTARLNPIIRGWANYFRIGVSSRTFQALDDWMFQREVRYVKRTHPNKSWHWQRAQYWGPFHPQRNDHWVFGDDRSGTMLLKFKWFHIYRHPLVTGTASPDDPALAAYWAERRRKQAYGLTPSKRKLAQRQGYVCPLCGDSLLDDEELHVHHERWRSRGGTDSYDNLSLHHLYCHQQVHAGNLP